jgi:hypothetical protein
MVAIVFPMVAEFGSANLIEYISSRSHSGDG